MTDEKLKRVRLWQKETHKLIDEEIEAQAEEYVVEKLREQEHQVCKDGVVNYIAWKTSEVEQAFKDGAECGMEHAVEWHDLRKDPTDLPKKQGTYVVYCYSLGYERFCYMEVPYSVSWGTLDKVIAWCELPQFNDKE